MDQDQIAEANDLITDALNSATDAAAVIASALGIGSETDAGYEVDAEDLEASEDPAAAALGRALTALADCLDALEPSDDMPAEGGTDAEAA